MIRILQMTGAAISLLLCLSFAHADDYSLSTANVSSQPNRVGPVGELPKNLKSQIEEAFKRTRESGPRFSLSGPLQIGKSAKYSVNGSDFEIGKNAIVLGDLIIGQQVSVRGLKNGSERVATHIHADNYSPALSQGAVVIDKGGLH